MNDEAEQKWLTRPLRNLTTIEIERSLQDRAYALQVSQNAMQSQFIQLEIDKLTAELEGRRTRQNVI